MASSHCHASRPGPAPALGAISLIDPHFGGGHRRIGEAPSLTPGGAAAGHLGSGSAPLLSVSGHIGRVNNATADAYDFSEAQFLKLATASITTGTSWTPTSGFVGPLLVDVMQAAGVTSGTLTFKTLDDYSAPIPWEDLVRYGVILAHSQDGQRLNNKRWGPLWTIYPRDQNPVALKGPIAESRFIWQVNRIEVSG